MNQIVYLVGLSFLIKTLLQEYFLVYPSSAVPRFQSDRWTLFPVPLRLSERRLRRGALILNGEHG
jgi:hypothetical protein